MIKLMGKTGICLGQLDPSLIHFLVQRIVTILATKEFVPVLLPWVTELSDLLLTNKAQRERILSQETVSDLIEVLIELINDTRSGIDEGQKNEINRIYENLSEAYKF